MSSPNPFWPVGELRQPNPKPLDNPRCFLCDEPANEESGSWLTCHRHTEGPVRWSKYDWSTPELKVEFAYQGVMVPFVDFTKPDAPSAPA